MAVRLRDVGNVIAFPARPGVPDLGDLRFRRLVGEEQWARLPEAVRARFSKRLRGGATALYAGEVVECRMSRIGLALAQLARLIRGPLPLGRDAWLPAVVAVTEDAVTGGQCWTRIYGRARGFPQVIRSAKLFRGPTGLEEQIGRGFGIALKVETGPGALHFVSDHYFLEAAGLRLRLPRWLAPGALRVSHVDCGHGSFAFLLSLVHPWFGELVRQTAIFSDPPRGDGR
jgi:hypothetical protein